MSILSDIARHLAEEVGEGNTFTADDLAKFTADKRDPKESAARRVRDLGKFGWEILSTRQDPTIEEGYRLIRIGEELWKPGGRRTPGTWTQLRDVELEDLTAEELRTLMTWVAAGQRPPDRLGAAWNTYAGLSVGSKTKFKAALFERLMQQEATG